MSDMILLGLGGVLSLLLFLLFWRSRQFGRALLFSLLSGNAALFAVGYLGAFTGVLLSVNLFTIAVSSFLGVPGVVGMLILKLFL